MEINKYTDITGVITAEAIVEGRMVLLTSHSFNHDYGSQVDLPAVRLPDTAADSAMAHFILTWAVDNTMPPIYYSLPTVANTSLRYGFDGAANVPFSATVHLTAPSMTEGQTIPSGHLALAFGPGVFTVPSGEFVYSASLVPGAWLAVTNPVSNAAEDAGKLIYSATASFAQVLELDSDQNLTFRINY